MNETVIAPSPTRVRHASQIFFLLAILALSGCDREPAKPPTPAVPTPPPTSEAATQVERLLNAGRILEANKLVDEYAPTQPDSNWEFLRLAARTKLNTGNPAAALIFAEKALATQPRDTETKVVLGMALVRTGQAARGEKLVSEMTSRFSRDPNFHCRLAEARTLAGKLPEAERSARDAVKLAPDDTGQAVLVAKTHQTLGMVLVAQQRYPEAIAEFRTALEIYKQSDGALYGLALALARTGKLDEARGSAERALALGPNNAAFAAQLGSILVEQKQWIPATATLEKAVALDPTQKSAWINLATAARQSGNPARAKAADEKAKELSGDATSPLKFEN